MGLASISLTNRLNPFWPAKPAAFALAAAAVSHSSSLWRVRTSRTIVNAIACAVSKAWKARNVTLEAHIAGDSAALVGDAKRLEQVFWNLLSNGIRFGREGGLVRVESVAEDDSVRITVEDDGPGIDPAFLPHVFEPFRQADPSPRRAHDGLGLGLAIARHLVELHGGTMAAANRSSGGAVFTVVLPARSAITSSL